MPRIFTDDAINNFLEGMKCESDETADERRERAAVESEKRGDYLQAWEMRTGRPWNYMTAKEALALVSKHPELMRNPGVLSRLIPRNG